MASLELRYQLTRADITRQQAVLHPKRYQVLRRALAVALCVAAIFHLVLAGMNTWIWWYVVGAAYCVSPFFITESAVFLMLLTPLSRMEVVLNDREIVAKGGGRTMRLSWNEVRSLGGIVDCNTFFLIPMRLGFIHVPLRSLETDEKSTEFRRLINLKLGDAS